MNMRCLRGQTPFCVAAFAPRWKPLQLLKSAYFAVAHPDRALLETASLATESLVPINGSD